MSTHYYTILLDDAAAVGRFDSRMAATRTARLLQQRGHRVTKVAPFVANLLDLQTIERETRTA